MVEPRTCLFFSPWILLAWFCFQLAVQEFCFGICPLIQKKSFPWSMYEYKEWSESWQRTCLHTVFIVTCSRSAPSRSFFTIFSSSLFCSSIRTESQYYTSLPSCIFLKICIIRAYSWERSHVLKACMVEYWYNVDALNWPLINTPLDILIDQSSVSPCMAKMSIECQPTWRSRIDQGYWLTLNCGCTHDLIPELNPSTVWS